jgi:UDP-N-acetylglucosamine pyrophosphorylase (EC 2.7.7.23)/glucosamine-1-phosphate N-acetyltransferase (EC 2.3.1.157)
VLYGDVPLAPAASLAPLVAEAQTGALALLTVKLDDPTGYGRILRDADGAVQGIVEHKDATPTQRAVRECNTGILCAPLPALRRWLGQLRNDNAQGEYYLTDVVALAVADGVPVRASTVADADDVLGVNDRSQLAHLERVVQLRAARRLLDAGVTLADPSRIDVRGACTAAATCSSTWAACSKAKCIWPTAPAWGPTPCCAMCAWARARWCIPSAISTARASARARSSAPSPGCGPRPPWPTACTSATSSK